MKAKPHKPHITKKRLMHNRKAGTKYSIEWHITCPKNPVVPLSTRGTLAAKQMRLTCRLASKLSRPFKTTSNCLKKSILNSGSLTFAWYGVIFMWGLNFKTASRATWWQKQLNQTTSPKWKKRPSTHRMHEQTLSKIMLQHENRANESK